MAAKLAELKKPATEEEETVGALPSKKAVTELTTEVRKHQQNMAKARGAMGAAIKTAETDHNVHRAAFRHVMKLEAMEPEARADFQRHVELYTKMRGLELQGDILKDTPKTAAR